MVLEVYLKILLVVLPCVTEFLIIFILPAKALRSFETCVLVNNNLCRKVASVPFFIPDFNLLSCELDNFLFKFFY